MVAGAAVSELLTFPAGKYDDQVDALGLCGQLLDVMVAGREAKIKEERGQYRLPAARAADRGLQDLLALSRTAAT